MRALDNGATGEDLRELLAFCISRHKRAEKLKTPDPPKEPATPRPFSDPKEDYV
jgi:hypothetical protein